MISSTPLRKSLSKKQDKQFPYTPIDSETDDDTERRSRRSVCVEQQRLASVSEAAPPAKTIEQITNHFKMCQKLFNENKINVHNAWDMKVIDYLHHYVSKNTVLQCDVILEGARMLEVCVKVYGYKVEYLGQEITKLAGSTKTKSMNDNDNFTDADNLQEDSVVGKVAKNKRRKKPSQITVAKNRSEVLVAEISKVVPIDFVGSVDIYANNHQNMFTNKTPMDHSAYRFNLLNNEDYGFISYNADDPTPEEKLFSNKFPKITSLVICSEFKHFNVDEEDQDFNESLVSTTNDLNNTVGRALVSNEIAYDEDGVPVPELDGSVHDVFADNVVDTLEDDELPIAQNAQRRVEMITSFCPSDAPIQKNNSIRSTLSNCFLETVWVGPSHWKNKLIRPSAPRYSGKTDIEIAHVKKKRKVSVRLKDTPINFDDSIEINLENKCKTNISFNKMKCTLPPSELIFPEFMEMMTQGLVPRQEYQSETTEAEFEHSPYDYNNADDSQYCSQVDLHDTSDNIGNKENDMLENNNENNCNDVPACLNTTNALIAAPDLVTQTYVPYALRAKHVNMKKLKSAMLHCLTHNSISGMTKENIHLQPSLFSEVFNELPTKLPKKDKGEISVALAYFCLLHITNEYNLKLTGSESLNNAKIEKL